MSITLKTIASSIGSFPIDWRVARNTLEDLVSVIDNRLTLLAAEINAISSGTTVVPTGGVIDFAGSSGSLPSGYLLCDGTVYNIADYTDLGALLGSTYGGNGTTTFGVPDTRGRVVAGQDDMGGSSANRVTDAQADSLGGVLGAEDHTTTISEMPAHDHTGSYVDYDLATGSKSGMLYTNGGGNFFSSNRTGEVVSQGGGTAHNNMQPTIFMNQIIKT